MSWQDYVDNQLIASQCVSKACIAGHDGGVWAKSENFEVSWDFELREKKKERRENSAVSSVAAAFVPQIRLGRPLEVSRAAAVGADKVSRKESVAARAIDVICHHVFRSPTGCV